jgi:hypothetical protein
MKTHVESISLMCKAISNHGTCPKCGLEETRLISTTNQWDGWCVPCDVRYNDKKQIQDPVTYETVNNAESS